MQSNFKLSKDINFQNSTLCKLPSREEIYDIDSITLEEHYRLIKLGLDFLLQKSSLSVEFTRIELQWQKKALKIIDIIDIELQERAVIVQFGSQIVSLQAEEEYFNKLNDYSSHQSKVNVKVQVGNPFLQVNNINSDFNKMQQSYFFKERQGEKIQKNQEENKQSIIDNLKKKCITPVPELSCVYEKTEDIEEKSILQDENSSIQLKVQKTAESQYDEFDMQKCYTTSSNIQRFDTQTSDIGLNISKLDENISMSFSHQLIYPINQSTQSADFQQYSTKNNQQIQQHSKFPFLNFQNVTTDIGKLIQNIPLSSPKFQKLGEKLNNKFIYAILKKTLQKTRIEQNLTKSSNFFYKSPSNHLHEHILNPFGKLSQKNQSEHYQNYDPSKKKLLTNINNNFQKTNNFKPNSSIHRKNNQSLIKQIQNQKLHPISTSMTQFQLQTDNQMDNKSQTESQIQGSQYQSLLSQSSGQFKNNKTLQNKFSSCSDQRQSYIKTSINFFRCNSNSLNNNIDQKCEFDCSNLFNQTNQEKSECQTNILKSDNIKSNSIYFQQNPSYTFETDEKKYLNEQKIKCQRQNSPYISNQVSSPSRYNMKKQKRQEIDNQNKQNLLSSTKGENNFIEIQKNLKKQILSVNDQSLNNTPTLTSPRIQRAQNKPHKSNSIAYLVNSQSQNISEQQLSNNYSQTQNKENIKNEIKQINKTFQNVSLNSQQKLKRSFSSSKKSCKQKFILDQRQFQASQSNFKTLTQQKILTDNYDQCKLMSKSQIIMRQPNNLTLQKQENNKKQLFQSISKINNQTNTLQSMNNERNYDQNSFNDNINQEELQKNFTTTYKINGERKNENIENNNLQEIKQCNYIEDEKQNKQNQVNTFSQIILEQDPSLKKDDNNYQLSQNQKQQKQNIKIFDKESENQLQQINQVPQLSYSVKNENQNIQEENKFVTQNKSLKQLLTSLKHSDYSSIDQLFNQKSQSHKQEQNLYKYDEEFTKYNEEQTQKLYKEDNCKNQNIQTHDKDSENQQLSDYDEQLDKYKLIEQNKSKTTTQNFKSYSIAVTPIQKQMLKNQLNLLYLENKSNFLEDSFPSKEENNQNENQNNLDTCNNNMQTNDTHNSFFSMNSNKNTIYINTPRSKIVKRINAPSFQINYGQKQIKKIQQCIGNDEDLIDYTDIIPSFECLFSGFYSNQNYQSANHVEFSLLQLMLEIYELFSDHVQKVDQDNFKNQNANLKKYKFSPNEQSPTDIVINQNPHILYQYQNKIDINIPRFINRCYIQQLNNNEPLGIQQKSEQNNLKQQDYFTQPYFRVIKNKTEVFEIVSKSFFRKSNWNELPHALNLKTSWNLLWTWAKPQIDFKKLFFFQKVNHFPENKNMSRKDLLFKNLRNTMKLGKNIMKEFDIMPQTYILPKEYDSFYFQFQQDQLEEKQKNIWILKPVSQSRGNGIYLINNISKVIYNEQMVAQKYLQNPLLIKGFKFDMRIYVLVTSFKPLEAFIYKEGFARMSTKPFSLDEDQIENKFIHLTNYAIQKMNQEQQNSESSIGGSKITLKMLKTQLEQQGIKWQTIWQQVEHIVLKSLIACQSEIQNNPNCFEIFGYDIIIDQNKKCWLLEINSSPSLARDYIIDDIIKQQLIDDAIDLVNPIQFDRQRLIEILERRIREEQGQKSTLHTQNHSKIQLNRDLNYILRKQKIRKVGETPQFMGDFQQISPSENSERLQKLVQSYKKERNLFQTQKFQSMKQKIFLNKINNLKE